MSRLRLLLLALLWPAPALAGEVVAFASAAPPGSLMRATLARPAGRAPFPAVVLLHSCLGLPGNLGDYERLLTRAGYVSLFVDDFTDRGLSETCSVDFPQGLGDALGGYAFLAGQSYVDARRIAVVGFSQGGDTALKLAARGGPFRAAAAFYPPCANSQGAKLRIPTLILVGARDEVTPAADCAGINARLVVLPGAFHLFDDPAFVGGKLLFDMRLQYDEAAARRARGELSKFLAENLAPEE